MTAVHIADTAGTEHGGPVVRSRQHRVLRWTVTLGAIALEVGLIAPLLTEHAPAFAAIQWGWVAAAVGAETASVVTIGAVYRPLLRAGGVSVTRRRSLATGATASAITAMVPAGPVASRPRRSDPAHLPTRRSPRGVHRARGRSRRGEDRPHPLIELSIRSNVRRAAWVRTSR